ncbi:vanadium-dependent haloperoxidase [Rubrolithibacter danxiaensis]|uniref:vanadium-dependent haloperoxidase n=1 Tax=Rubrolithibacter danxiaensis TaxID=3390805 RepID=UPI003BF82649
MKVFKVLILLLFAGSISVSAQWEKHETDAFALHRSQKAVSNIIVHDVFSPPVASRIFAYANIAAYEIQAKQNKKYVSMGGQINEFKGIAAPKNAELSYSVAATFAYLQVAKRLVFSEDMVSDSIKSILKWYTSKGYPEKVIQNSLTYGQSVADSIIAYASKDHYGETRRMRRYAFIKQEGKWQPTPPGYMAAVEPNWNKIRPFVMNSPDQFKPLQPFAYSTDKKSDFYKSAYEVYLAVNQLTAEQRHIASFWDCNPFFLNTQGHLNFATKKISPGAHWMSIAGIALTNKHADYMKSSAVYTYTSLAIFDAFISCWDEKYRSNYIRPETFINAHIDESWKPLLQTPPFPEYPSGHSVASTAAATVLTALLGDNIVFDDNTETDYGLPVRKFPSFIDAANEAAISRLYGGIHFREAIVNGQKQGKALGDFIVQKIRVTANQPIQTTLLDFTTH